MVDTVGIRGVQGTKRLEKNEDCNKEEKKKEKEKGKMSVQRVRSERRWQ